MSGTESVRGTATLVDPSKGSGGENFPVGSFLMGRARRPHILAFYRVARAADDIADSDALTPDEKIARLDRIERALDGHANGEAADLVAPLLATQAEHGCGVTQVKTLLQAFRQDARQARYDTFDDLLAYCRLSADPVGRFLLALTGEGAETHGPSDALCTALQILNHLQDTAEDRATLDRVYLPQSWLAGIGGEAVWFDPEETTKRRELLDALLDRVDDLLDRAAGLPVLVRDARLKMEAGVTYTLARRLAQRLRGGDPVRARVALTKPDFAAALLTAPGWRRAEPSEARDRRDVARRVVRARSSFAAGMKSLPADRRAALYAVYAISRAVDDVADAPLPAEVRLKGLERWREALARVRADTPDTPLERELVRARTRFDLPLIELDRLIDGMARDCAPVRTGTACGLAVYCRRAAGTVGLLSAQIFGLFERPDDAATARRFALALAEGFQLVNVLRDVAEDRARDRLYLPSALTGADTPAALTEANRLHAAAVLGPWARARLEEADRLATRLPAPKTRAARLMARAYRARLDAMEAAGWAEGSGDLSRTAKLRLLLP